MKKRNEILTENQEIQRCIDRCVIIKKMLMKHYKNNEYLKGYKYGIEENFGKSQIHFTEQFKYSEQFINGLYDGREDGFYRIDLRTKF